MGKLIDRRSMMAGSLGSAFAIGSHHTAMAQSEEILLGIPVETSNSLMFMVAAAAGYFKVEGFPGARVVMPQSGTNVRQMLAAGQMPFAMGDPIHPLAVTGAGKSTKMLMSVDTRASITMIVRQDLYDKGITSLKAFGDLKKPDGSKPSIGVTRVGAQTWLYGDQLMRNVGKIDNVTFVNVGDGASMLGAFKTGRVDALMANSLIYFATQDEKLGSPVFNAVEEKIWLEFFGSTFPGQVCFALADQIKTNPDIMQGLVNAVYRALQHIKNSTPEDLVKLVQPQFMGNFKPEVAAREIEYLKPIYSYTGEITEAQFNSGGKVWFSEGTKVAPQPYKDMVDLTFLSKARAKYG